jgi:hypothetical protein
VSGSNYRGFTLLFLVALVGCSAGSADNNAPVYPTYDPSLPNPIPASCPQNTTLDPSAVAADLRALTPFWIGNTTLLVGHGGSPIWRSGANDVWWRADEQPSVQMNLLEGQSAPATIEWKASRPPLFASTVTLPTVGCWEFLTTVKGQLVRFLVYAYSARVAP